MPKTFASSRRCRPLATALAVTLFVLLGLVRSAHAASANIVISQVYGGGGNSGAMYRHDFIELFNRGAIPIDVSGWSVQYAASTGSSWQATPLSDWVRDHLIGEEALPTGTWQPSTAWRPEPKAAAKRAMTGIFWA